MANRNAVGEILKSTDFARHICCQAGTSQGSNTKLLLDQLVLVVTDRTSTITRSTIHPAISQFLAKRILSRERTSFPCEVAL